MKAVLSITLVVVGLASFASQAQAQDNLLPRGGWDGNNVRISASHVKLLPAQSPETSIRGGGWDANNLRVSVTKSKLLGAQK